MQRILPLFVLFLAAGAHAELGVPSACDTTIDLRNPGESMEGLEATNQGDAPNALCGFFAFSSYLDAFRISRLGEQGNTMARTSAVSVGVENAIRRKIPYWFPIQNSTDPLANRAGRWGATFCALAGSVREVGYCADDSLPTRNEEETGKFSDLLTYIYEPLLQIAETTASLRKNAIDERIGTLYGKYAGWAMRRNQSLLDQDQMRAIIEKNPTVPYATIQAIFFPKCGFATKRRNDLKFDACKTEAYVGLDMTGLPSRNQDPLRTDRALRRVIELLERPHALPVPFSYCSAVLKDGKAYRGTSPIFGDCGIHWSLIAGRRRIGKDCFMLVHNTWGPDATYSKDWVVDGKGIWVREQELTRSMLLTQWLETR